jgi:hypothetical protein
MILHFIGLIVGFGLVVEGIYLAINRNPKDISYYLMIYAGLVLAEYARVQMLVH